MIRCLCGIHSRERFDRLHKTSPILHVVRFYAKNYDHFRRCTFESVRSPLFSPVQQHTQNARTCSLAMHNGHTFVDLINPIRLLASSRIGGMLLVASHLEV